MLEVLNNVKFMPLFLTHCFGTLCDNLAKNIFVFLAAFFVQGSVYWIATAFAFYGLAFLVTSLFFGSFADKYSKALIIRRLKLLEVCVMALTLVSINFENRVMMLVCLTAFGFCSSAIRIVKYALLPELVSSKGWLSANALLKGFSFVSAILAMLMLYGLYISTRSTLFVMGGALMVSSILGYIFSLRLENDKTFKTNTQIPVKPINFIKQLSHEVESNSALKFYLTAIAWYWLLGSVIAFFALNFCKTVLMARSSVLVAGMLVFSAGFIVGSFLCPYLFERKKMKGLMPICAFALSIFFLDCLAASHVLPQTKVPYNIQEFLLLGINAYRFFFDIFMGAVCAALFIVPLYPLVQQATPKTLMGRVFGYSAFICALAVIGSILIVFSLNVLHIPLIAIFIVLALVNVVFALYSCQILSYETRQRIFRKILTWLFDVDFSGLENLKNAGSRVLIIPNHTAYVDALIISAFIDRPITFFVTKEMAHKLWVRILGNLMELKKLDAKNPFSVKTVVEELKSGKLCMILPESHLPNGNTLMKVYEGPALMVQKANAKVLPVQIKGLEYSAYSRLPGKSRLNLMQKVTVEILPAQELKTEKNVTFHEARRQSSNKLYEILAAMRLDACDLNQTLLEAVIKSMHRVGRNKQMMEDTDRKPLKFKQIFLRAFILGGLINKALPEDHTVGLMLPTSNACVLSLLGLQAYGKVPAMLNFSSGPKQVISTCHTAQITKVITAKKVVALAKLETLIDALTNDGIQVVYLEDLKKILKKKDILSCLFGSFFPMSFYRKNAGYVKPSDPAVILFTSGSEGVPKGVLLSHSNVLANAFQILTMFDVWDNDVMLNCLPIFHSFGLSIGTFMPLVFGFKMVSYPTPLHYRAIPEFCSSVRATIFFSTDTFLSGYAKCANPYDFNSLRIVAAGAEALKEETRRTWTEKFGVRVFEGYGATECSPIIAANTFLRTRFGSVGCLMTGMQYKLKEVPGIKDGKELVVKGPNVMIGYMKNDKPGVLQPPKDGWYETGDIVDIDKDGFVFIKGRSKRFAKIAGEMVSLLAVETAIATQFKGFIHGVVSVPDPKKGEQLVLITTCGDVTAEKLVSLFKDAGLPELAIPKKIIFTDHPPLFSTGKFDYPTATELAKKQINQ